MTNDHAKFIASRIPDAYLWATSSGFDWVVETCIVDRFFLDYTPAYGLHLSTRGCFPNNIDSRIAAAIASAVTQFESAIAAATEAGFPARSE